MNETDKGVAIFLAAILFHLFAATILYSLVAIHKKFILLISAAFAFCFNGNAQNLSPRDSMKQVVVGGMLHHGFIFVHSYHVENVRGARPSGFQLEYAKHFTDSVTYSKYHCYPAAGWLFNYTYYDKSFLGSAWSAAYFLEPQYRISDKINFHIRGTLGASYLTQPYDSIKNPNNVSYSLPINFYLQLGAGFSYHISNHTSLNLMGGFFHNSNGDLAEPNRGVNYINYSLGLSYHEYSNKLPQYIKTKDTSWRRQGIKYEASFFFNPKQGYDSGFAPKRKFVAGVNIEAIKQVSASNAITLGAEVYYDDAIRSIKDLFNDNTPSTLAGILVGHRFLINKFSFSQQMGFYVYKHLKEYNNYYGNRWHTLYQRYGINYHIKTNWYVGVNLLTHAQVADFIDGRVVYRF